MQTPPITIYTTKTCGYCKATKELFREHNISFSEIDVSSNREKAREMIEKSGQMGVPVIIIGEGSDEKTIVGFDKQAFSEALGISL
jgi:glutaredoxin 3